MVEHDFGPVKPPTSNSIHEIAPGRLDPEIVAAAQMALVDREILEARLAEAEETLRAIRAGEVDAIVVADDARGEQVFTLTGADRPYRIFVENMRDGAATISESGLVLYANQRLATLLGLPLSKIVGLPFSSFLPTASRSLFEAAIDRAEEGRTVEMEIRRVDGKRVASLIGLFRLDVETERLICITITDLSIQKAQEREISRLARVQSRYMAQLQTAVTALTEQATHDSLTGLPNRVVLVDRLEQTLIRAERTGAFTGLIFVDLDHFKAVNDNLGHTAGDTVLCRVASALRETVRSMDTIARLGGDEFVILCPDLQGPADALDISQRIVAAIGRISSSCEEASGLTASVGVSVVESGAATAGTTLAEADTAMYHAKSLGRNRTELFHRELRSHRS